MQKVHTEKTAFGMLVIWCLLPVAMSVYCVLNGYYDIPYVALGNTEYHFTAAWYPAQVYAYVLIFRILGCATLAFAIYAVVFFRKHIFTLNAVREHPWFFFLFALLIWSILSSILSDDFSNAFVGNSYDCDGLSSYFIMAGLFVCASMVSNEDRRRRILCLFCTVLAYLSILTIIQVHFDTVLDLSLMPDLGAVFNQHNHFGYLLGMGIVGFTGLFLLDEKASKGIKILYLLGEAVLLYTLILNTTFGAFLAAFMTLTILYIFYLKSGRKLSVSAFLPILVFLAVSAAGYLVPIPAEEALADRIDTFISDVGDVSSGSENAIHAGKGRVTLWLQTIERIKERPIFGYGPNGFVGEHYILSHDGVTHDGTHNEFLQMAGYTGIPSLIFYLSALMTLAIYHWKKLKELKPMVIATAGVTVAYLISSFVGMPIFNTNCYLWLFLGLTTATDEIKEWKSGGEETKRHSIIAGVIISLAGCVAIGSLLYMRSVIINNEKVNELADLQAMRNAELTVKTKDDKGKLDGTDFWYDANTYRLIPLTEEVPQAYGLGTTSRGSITEVFNWKYDSNCHYDDRIDYRDKVIKVHVEGTGDDLKVDMEWVSVEN